MTLAYKLKCLAIFIAAMTITNACLASTMSKDQILRTFNEYAALNDDFVSAVPTGTSPSSGKPYVQLRTEVERFADGGPFEEALSSTGILACAHADDSLVGALIHVILRTTNSASEDPDGTLGHIFVCQPESVKRAFKRLDPHTQREFYERLANGVIGAIQDEKVKGPDAQRLHLLLDQMAPRDR
jgi:hypothetical protein